MKLTHQHTIKIVLILCIATATWLITHFSSDSTYKVFRFDPKEKYMVVSVLDGDTLEIKMGKKTEKVRMIGIDTPETLDPRKPIQCYGKESSNETKSMLLGRSVTLASDPTQYVKDKFGRFLAYVYRDDGLFVNQRLLEQGYAREYTYGRAYKFQKEFKALEASAQDQKKGLWEYCNDMFK
jgi:micrococcal nuclease